MLQAGRKIAHAFWEPDGSCVVLLVRDYQEVPPLKLKSAGLELGVLERLGKAEIGAYYGYYFTGQDYVFTVDLNDYPQLQNRMPRIFIAGDFNGWGDAIGRHEWELLPGSKAKRCVYERNFPVDTMPNGTSFQFKFVTENGVWLDVPKTVLNAVQASDGIINFEFNPNQTGGHCFCFRMCDSRMPVGNEQLVWQDEAHKESYDLSDLESLLSASTDLPLGAFVKKNQTTFRLFAPRASEVQLAYGFEADHSDAVFIEMQCIDGVTWETIVRSDLSGAYYSFHASGENRDGTTDFDASFAILDPYAKACVGNYGPGIVVNPKRLKKVKKSFMPPPLQDLVILEGHIRDLTVGAPIEPVSEVDAGFSGLRKWVQSEGSYLRQMGVNAVELMPIQQIGDIVNTGYHWGYMSANYFSPASNYACEPENTSQIDEFRDLVQAFHDEGIALIMDVVYNHIGEPYHLSYIDKYYFLNLDENNERTNWSGCGNDLRCDTPMARRLIIESLKHFIKVYDIDGFRFDLAELIGIDVLREIETELKKIKPSIILIAEPWSFRGRIQDELKKTGYAAWNDGFRESIASYVCGVGTANMIQYFLSGSPNTSRFVAQTINYTESHDDYCWIDRITERPEHKGSSPTWLDQRRTHLMASILFTSLGVPMLASGQDFMRSKLGIPNTYQLADVNALDYGRRLLYSGTHAYFREWIHFRLSTAGQALRYGGPLEEGYLEFFAAEGFSSTVAVFNSNDSIEAPKLIYAINPHSEPVSIECDADLFESALQIADHERINVQGLQSARIPTEAGVVQLPPFSCGLWLINFEY